MATTRLTGQAIGASLATLLLSSGAGLGGATAAIGLILCAGALASTLFYTHPASAVPLAAGSEGAHHKESEKCP